MTCEWKQLSRECSFEVLEEILPYALYAAFAHCCCKEIRGRGIWVFCVSVYGVSEFPGALGWVNLWEGEIYSSKIHRIHFLQKPYFVYLLGTSSLKLFDTCDNSVSTEMLSSYFQRTWVIGL